MENTGRAYFHSLVIGILCCFAEFHPEYYHLVSSTYFDELVGVSLVAQILSNSFSFGGN